MPCHREGRKTSAGIYRDVMPHTVERIRPDTPPNIV